MKIVENPQLPHMPHASLCCHVWSGYVMDTASTVQYVHVTCCCEHGADYCFTIIATTATADSELLTAYEQWGCLDLPVLLLLLLPSPWC